MCINTNTFKGQAQSLTSSVPHIGPNVLLQKGQSTVCHQKNKAHCSALGIFSAILGMRLLHPLAQGCIQCKLGESGTVSYTAFILFHVSFQCIRVYKVPVSYFNIMWHFVKDHDSGYAVV